MKKFLPLFLATAFIFAGTMVPSEADLVTVTGTLVDTKCYGMMPEANIGNTHKMMKGDKMMDAPKCATACAAMGIPAGIVEGGKAGNQTYVLITPTNQLKKHMSKEARVTGEIAYEGAIMPMKIEVKEDGEWKDITPKAMM